MENGMQRALAVLEKGKLALVEIPIPEPDDYEVLVKNEACCYCNTTDQMITENGYATPSYPTILGHECFGPVVKVGKKVTKYKIGDRVICSNAIVSGSNGEYCSSFGGFCEYGIAGDLEAYLADHGTLDAKNQYRARYAANSIIDSSLSYRAASLAFPLAEVASAIRQVGDITGKTVVIIGTGVMGSFHVLFAKLYGAKNIIAIDRAEKRLALAKKFGATATFLDVKEIIPGEHLSAAEVIRAKGDAPQQLLDFEDPFVEKITKGTANGATASDDDDFLLYGNGDDLYNDDELDLEGYEISDGDPY